MQKNTRFLNALVFIRIVNNGCLSKMSGHNRRYHGSRMRFSGSVPIKRNPHHINPHRRSDSMPYRVREIAYDSWGDYAVRLETDVPSKVEDPKIRAILERHKQRVMEEAERERLVTPAGKDSPAERQ